MRTEAESGFTLVETLVALAIFVLGFVALSETLSIGWRAMRATGLETTALQLAKSKLAAAGITTPLAEGQESGQTEAGLHWTIDIRRYAPPSGNNETPELDAHWVSVEVSWGQGLLRRPRTIELKSLKLGYRP